MANSETPSINNQNVQNIRNQIAMKKGDYPFLATSDQYTQVITDYDTFPYPRWFRGIPQLNQPVVAEREAGWRKRDDKCYKVLNPNVGTTYYPNHCFEVPCSTVYPCFVSDSTKYTNREETNAIINNECVVQYR